MAELVLGIQDFNLVTIPGAVFIIPAANIVGHAIQFVQASLLSSPREYNLPKSRRNDQKLLFAPFFYYFA